MSESAESWLDRGLQALTAAASDNVEIQRARAIEQHCARRAAIRNPQYRDRTGPDINIDARRQSLSIVSVPTGQGMPTHAREGAGGGAHALPPALDISMGVPCFDAVEDADPIWAEPCSDPIGADPSDLIESDPLGAGACGA
jgi:hypothetical protein